MPTCMILEIFKGQSSETGCIKGHVCLQCRSWYPSSSTCSNVANLAFKTAHIHAIINSIYKPKLSAIGDNQSVVGILALELEHGAQLWCYKVSQHSGRGLELMAGLHQHLAGKHQWGKSVDMPREWQELYNRWQIPVSSVLTYECG